MSDLKKKLILMTAPMALFSYFAIFANGVLAYTPQTLYDDVWKLINTKYVDANENGQKWTRWRHKYDNVIKSDDDAFVAIETMVASLNDPYTRFLDPEEFAEEGRSIDGTLFGIGIQIGTREDKLLIISPIEETPAAKAGLQANDEIIEINSITAKGMSVKDAADKIRGKQGTPVELIIKRGNANKKYTILREKINVKAVSIKDPKFVKLDKKVGYIRLNSFISSTASQEIKEALKAESDKDGIILDLRSNPGGLLTNAINIADMFLDNGTIVSTVDRDGYKETQNSTKGVISNKPLVILIDGGSASASEILSGALKDNGRAVLVGAKSFGKGLVQEINRLSGGAGINITTQKYLTPNGTDINKKGIVPDIEVKLTEDDVKKNRDTQLEKAQQVMLNLITQGKDNNKTVGESDRLKIIVH